MVHVNDRFCDDYGDSVKISIELNHLLDADPMRYYIDAET